MSSTQPILAPGPSLSVKRSWRPAGSGHLRGSDFTWSIAFVVPYAAVFLAFTLCPMVYALWSASKLSLYADLFTDPLYLRTVVNTLVFVGVGVNLMMFLSLLLSGFFMRRRWWIKALLVVYILPWALPAVQAFISVHWILIGDMGLVNRLLEEIFGIEGPLWMNERWTAHGANIVAYIWKWMPFWTVIFLAGRMALPRELYEAADVDGATGYRRFMHVTCPLLATLYLVCTLLSTIWTLGDFSTVYFVSGGGPAMSTEVLATLGIRDAFVLAQPRLGVAAVMSALPVLIPIVVLLMHKLRTSEVQL
jgi:multiple sugar transport system permease protein